MGEGHARAQLASSQMKIFSMCSGMQRVSRSLLLMYVSHFLVRIYINAEKENKKHLLPDKCNLFVYLYIYISIYSFNYKGKAEKQKNKKIVTTLRVRASIKGVGVTGLLIMMCVTGAPSGLLALGTDCMKNALERYSR